MISIAVTYTDQFILNKLKSLVQGFLADSNFIRQDVLANLPSDLVESFINTYCSDQGHKGMAIPVTMTFPQQAQTNPFILVQFKQGVEAPEDSSIGNIQGSIYSSNQGDEVVAKLPIVTKNGQAYINLPEHVYSVYHIQEVTQFKFKDNKVYLPYFPFYETGQHYAHVTYERKADKSGKELIPKGIMEQQKVVVDFCSMNMETLRCMVGILTSVSIFLKDTLEANSDIELPTISTEGTDLVMELNDPTTSVSGQQVYYRRMTISFKSLHTLPISAGSHVNKYHTGIRLGNGGITENG